jgi:endonuclease/exonuclease/phosphatase (EEP) superfamily protein YafD
MVTDELKEKGTDAFCSPDHRPDGARRKMSQSPSYLPPSPPPPEKSGVLRPIAAQAGWTLFWLAFGAACLGALSPLFAAQFWIAEILCHFQPQYAISMAVLALPLAIARRWKGLGMVLTAFAFTGAVWIAPLYIGTPHAGPAKLRVLSANVGCLNASPTRFLKLVEAEKPDVILIFELTHPWAQSLHLDEKGYPHGAFVPSPGHSGCGIYSRHPLKDAKIRTVNPYPNFLPSAKLTLGQKTLRIIGTHPWAPYTREEWEMRNQQMANLAALFSPIKVATMVAGDFNTSSWSPCFADFVEKTGLRDTRRGFGLLTTFPTSFWPFRTTIDHCLVSSDIFVVDRRVGPDIGSDHLPIIVDLTWTD